MDFFLVLCRPTSEFLFGVCCSEDANYIKCIRNVIGGDQCGSDNISAKEMSNFNLKCEDATEETEIIEETRNQVRLNFQNSVKDQVSFLHSPCTQEITILMSLILSCKVIDTIG